MTKPDFPVTIYHNPNCGTSRNTLAILEQAGLSPTVVRYVDAGWTQDLLKELVRDSGLSVRGILRSKQDLAAQLGLLDETITEEALLAAMVEHPILVERPIVKTPRGVALCRPSEKVFDLLDDKPESFTKEDGEVVRPK